MLRLSAYFQCWEKPCIRKEDVILGLPDDFLEKVRSQFTNHYIFSENERYTESFIAALRELHLSQYDVIFVNGLDTEADDNHHRQRSREWTLHFDLWISRFWTIMYPRIKYYAAYSDHIIPCHPPAKGTTAKLRFDLISSLHVRNKGVNFGRDIPRDVSFLGYQLWVSDIAHVITLGEHCNLSTDIVEGDIVDSGASKTISPDKDRFIDFQEISGRVLKVASGHIMRNATH